MPETTAFVKCPGYAPEHQCNGTASPGQLCASCKGKRFELDAVKALKDLGGRVVHNITVDGSQCDILATFEQQLGTVIYYVECKAYETPVGVAEVNSLYGAFTTAKTAQHCDKALLVALSGFTADAKAKAASTGIVLSTLDELKDRRADFRPYLSSATADYEHSDFFRKKYYLSVTADDFRLPDQMGNSSSRTLENWITDFCEDREKGSLLLVMGDFGAGKTTTMRRVFWNQAKKVLAGTPGCRIPILVNLRDFQMTMDLNKTLIGLLIDEYGLRFEGLRVFKDLNREGKLLLLLDGFDEMVAKLGPEFTISAFKQLEKVVEEHTKIVLTIRTHFLKSESEISRLTNTSALREYVQQRGHVTLQLNPLSQSQIGEYVQHVSPACLDLLRNEKLAQLATRPLLLNMIVETLPILKELDRPLLLSDLYFAYTDQWLDHDDWRCKMDHNERRWFSQELAYSFFQTNSFSLHYSALPPIIRRAFPAITKFSDLEYFDMDVRTSSFLQRDISGNYSFSHKSFYEYFLASKIVNDVKSEREVSPSDQFPPEIIEWIEDVIRAMWNSLSEAQRGRVLFGLCQVYAYSSIASPDRSVGKPVEVSETIQRTLDFASTLLPADRCLIAFEYAARKFMGTVACAISAVNWQPLPMLKIPGSPNHFLHFGFFRRQLLEYKFLEDGKWEPRDNRWIDMSNDAVRWLRDWQEIFF